VSDNARTPQLRAVVEEVLEDALLEAIRGALPGRVVRVDQALGQVDVQPTTPAYVVGEDGERVVEPYPVVPSVPLLFQGSGPWYSSCPVAVGDFVLLVFSEQSVDKWMSSESETDSLFDRRFSLADAFAIPGLRTTRSPAPAMSDRWVIGYAGGPRVSIGNGDIRIEDEAGGALGLPTLADFEALRLHVAGLLVGGTGSAVIAPPAAAVGTLILKGK
jgi:hypothetical protein